MLDCEKEVNSRSLFFFLRNRETISLDMSMIALSWMHAHINKHHEVSPCPSF